MTTLEQDTLTALKRMANAVRGGLDGSGWERRRFIVAALMLPFCAKDATDEGIDCDDYEGYMACTDIAKHCRAAIDYADELIRQLREKN